MGKYIFTSAQVSDHLYWMRDALRDGHRVVEKEGLFKSLADLITSDFGFGRAEHKKLLCSSEGIVSPKIAERFGRLFAVPEGKVSQDDYAWAIQNFINRRKEPWAFWYARQAKSMADDIQEVYA